MHEHICFCSYRMLRFSECVFTKGVRSVPVIGSQFSNVLLSEILQQSKVKDLVILIKGCGRKKDAFVLIYPLSEMMRSAWTVWVMINLEWWDPVSCSVVQRGQYTLKIVTVVPLFFNWQQSQHLTNLLWMSQEALCFLVTFPCSSQTLVFNNGRHHTWVYMNLVTLNRITDLYKSISSQ